MTYLTYQHYSFEASFTCLHFLTICFVMCIVLPSLRNWCPWPVSLIGGTDYISFFGLSLFFMCLGIHFSDIFWLDFLLTCRRYVNWYYAEVNNTLCTLYIKYIKKNLNFLYHRTSSRIWWNFTTCTCTPSTVNGRTYHWNPERRAPLWRIENQWVVIKWSHHWGWSS